MLISRKFTIVLILAILALGFILRFYRIASFPPINADEAALGYNAWSLIETGKDEHGNSWPVHLQSFNDYKPALYAYLLIPLVKLGGLNSMIVRIPGALIGVITILLMYLLAAKIVERNDTKKVKELFPLAAALFIAVSPWHMHFSRGAWEVNVATFFVTLGIYLFLVALRRPRIYLISFISFTLSLYTYHAARVVVPLLGLGLVTIYFKDIIKNWKPFLVSGVIVLVLLIPLVSDLTGPAGLSRAAGVGIFSDSGPLNEINEQRGEHGSLSNLSAKILHNKPLNYSIAIIDNWGEHFTGNFLFISGDEIQRNKVPEHGQMYLIDILFILIGFVAIARKFDRDWASVLYWLIVSPIAAALTFQSPHALRAQNMVIPLVLISAYGFTDIILYIHLRLTNKFIRITCYFSLISIMIWSFARYQQLYWIHMPRAYPYSSQYGFHDMISFVTTKSDDFDNIIITDRYDQPYILSLFYLKYSPVEFQNDHVLTARDGYGFSTVRSFDKFRFTSIGQWGETARLYPKSLIVGTDEEIPDETNIIKEIYFPNGEVAYQIVAN